MYNIENLKERIQNLKIIRSYIDDIAYYTKKDKPACAYNLYDYICNIIDDLKQERDKELDKELKNFRRKSFNNIQYGYFNKGNKPK